MYPHKYSAHSTRSATLRTARMSDRVVKARHRAGARCLLHPPLYYKKPDWAMRTLKIICVKFNQPDWAMLRKLIKITELILIDLHWIQKYPREYWWRA